MARTRSRSNCGPPSAAPRSSLLRDFAWRVYKVEISKAKLPDTRYRPQRTSESTVRFKNDGIYFGINLRDSVDMQVDPKTSGFLGDGGDPRSAGAAHYATLWVKVTDGAWAEDGNWGGCLQITLPPPRASGSIRKMAMSGRSPQRATKVAFCDMGDYYEIWQKDRETGRPLVVRDGYLRFVGRAEPGKWNLLDSTWD
ncbi:hypothetical protein GTW59_35005 [Streptomyces sp. SID89]|nr:hypothetical protein [Streptomyces sp. SID89]